MKKRPELDDIDVVFDPTPLTEKEKKLISEYIRQDKAKSKRKPDVRQRASKSRNRYGKKEKRTL